MIRIHTGRVRHLVVVAAVVLVVLSAGVVPAAPTASAALTSSPAGSSTSATSVHASAVRPGYYLGASDGGVYAFGTGNLGQLRPTPLNKPVVSIAAAPQGGGYWLVASDGGIFTYGVAGFYGSTGNVALNKPIVGMAATPDGKGYWLVASDGGIFQFGDAGFYGSTGNVALNKPIVGMAASPTGGYWLVASDGGLFDFGGAPYLGSTGSAPGPAPVVGIASTGFGAEYPAGAIGTDISWPQCGESYPVGGNPVSIVGVNDGSTFTTNPCFQSEAANAGLNLTVYINVNAVTTGDPRAMSGPAGSCAASDLNCQGYNWGFDSAQSSVDYAHAAGYTPQVWWLDVEGPCGSSNVLWMCGSAGQASNAAVIQGAIDALHDNGLTAGIYSTYYQWPLITGGSPGADTVNFPGLPIWIATVPSSVGAWPGYCTDPAYSFAAGTPWLIQWLGGSGSPTDPYDGDLACAL